LFPLSPRKSALLAFVSGLLYWLAFAGVDIWPLAFVAFVPLLIALRDQTPKRAALFGLVCGTTMNVTGFYWLLEMLRVFSGFPTVICMVFVLIISSYQGGRLALMGWLYSRGEARGHSRNALFTMAFAASELAYPLLFPWYFAGTVHKVPLLTQTAELGGPILIGVLVVLVNLALSEVVFARLESRAINVKQIALLLVAPALGLIFSAVRILQVDASTAAAPSVRVGLVQGNMGLLQKREDPGEGLRRHVRLTESLKQQGVDFVVWSESSVTFPVRETVAAAVMRDSFARSLGLPTIFGGVLYRLPDPTVQDDFERWFNTALATDAHGETTSRYDKHFLLAFGEYLPLGEAFPILHKWSPNSGRFSPGKELSPLKVVTRDGPHVVAPLICYEDILPGFTNAMVRATDPELLVNMTNDAWFGDTAEPWEHLALAKFRAIEHRRYLVRSTNSGVSAVVDPVGRVVVQTKTFEEAAPSAVVKWMKRRTVYEMLGDIPWIVCALLSSYFAFFQRRAWNKSRSTV